MQVPRSVKARVVLATVTMTLFATVVSIAVGAWQVRGLTDRAVDEQNATMQEQLRQRTAAVYDLVEAQASSVAGTVDSSLEVARHVLADVGPVTRGEAQVRWQATDQFSRQTVEVELPELRVGDTWLGQNTDPEVRTPVVDDVTDLVGGTMTVFQRMGEDGDMLRVATNVLTTDGQRGVGTYIPAVNPDGAPNPVVSAVLAGETYRGIAYVVNAWYVTAYEPIVDEGGEVVGILYVGVRQENVPELRAAVEATVLGRTGTVTVVGGTGDDAGQVVMSGTHTDGAALAAQVGAAEEGWLDDLLATATGAPGTVQQGPTISTAAGPSVTTAVYHQDWDWAILGIVPEDELTEAADAVEAGGSELLLRLVLSGVVVLAIGAALSWWVSRSIAGSVQTQAVATSQATAAIGQATSFLAASVGTTTEQAVTTSDRSDDVSHSVQDVATAVEELNASFAETARSAEQIDQAAREAVVVVERAVDTISQLGDSSAEIGQVIELINRIAEQTNLLALNATIEAARAGEAGKGFAVVADEVKDLAQETATATEGIAERVAMIQRDAEEAVGGIDRVKSVIASIADMQTTTASAVQEQTATAAEIARTVTLTAGSSSMIADSATLVAQNSREARDALHGTEQALSDLRRVVGDLLTLSGARAVAATPASPQEPPTPPSDPERTSRADQVRVLHRRAKGSPARH